MLPLIPLIGAGAKIAGSVGSAIINRKAGFTDSEEARLKELQRRAALGQLGLSDDEIAKYTAQRMNPLQAQQRESRLRAQADTAAMDAGAGAYFKSRQGEDQRSAEVLDKVNRDVQVMDAQRAREERMSLEELAAKRDQGKIARRQNILGAVTGVIGGAAEVADIFGQARADKEAREAIYGTDPLDGIPEDDHGLLTETYSTFA